MAVRHIRLEIGELVLHGFPARERHRIGDALQANLERTLSAPDVLGALASQGIALDQLILPAVRGDARPDRLGAALARAIATGLASLGGSVQPDPRSGSGHAPTAPAATRESLP